MEQSLNSSEAAAGISSPPTGLKFRPGRPATMPKIQNLYSSTPRLGMLQQSGQHAGEEVKRVGDILLRRMKRNPLLVGTKGPTAVMKELLRRIQRKEWGEGLLNNVEVIRLDRHKILRKMNELRGLIETRMANSNGGRVILDLDNLKWLVEPPRNFEWVSDLGSGHLEQVQAVVIELGKLLARFGENGGTSGRLWLIGTATWKTYFKCQRFHPSFETDWDLQAVPIVTPLSGLFPTASIATTSDQPQVTLAEWAFLLTGICLEIFSLAFDQTSSPSKPQYALFGMILAIAAVLISISELIYKGKSERVQLRQWGLLWWFYYPHPRGRLFGSLPDFYGLLGGFVQSICSTVQYVYIRRHANNPIKVSLWPAIFLICLGAKRLTKNRNVARDEHGE